MINTPTQPYFDDFDESKNFHKILVKGRRAVQVRELNQIQSILQNQVQRLGDHILDNGSMVIPGEFNFNFAYEYVKLSGVDYAAIVDLLLTNPVEIVDTVTGKTATIVQHMGATGGDPVTFYVQYSNSEGSASVRFQAGTSLNIKIIGGANFATASVTESGQGSVFVVNDGVYYINGYFVATYQQKILLSKYTTTPTATVGFRLIQSFVTSNEDTSLLDNAANTPNFNAPGADRLKLDLVLEVIPEGSAVDKENFIELAAFANGVPQKLVRGPSYSVLDETLARRTYDESGDYTVESFGLGLREHLDDGTNGGLYPLPTGDATKFVVGVEPGKAYVRGFEVENMTTRYVEVDKARDVASENNLAFTMPVGSFITVTSANTVPNFSQLGRLDFYNGGFTTAGNPPSGSPVGSAKIRYVRNDFVNNKLVIYLFDVRNAAGIADSKFITNGQIVYTPGFTATLDGTLQDSVNYSGVARLPVVKAKTLSDVSLSVTRYFDVTSNASGVVTITCGANEIFSSPSSSNAVAKINGGPSFTDITAISTLSGTPAGRSLVIDFGVGQANKAIKLAVPVFKQTGVAKSKVLTNLVVNKTPGDVVSGKIKLGKADVVELVSVIENGVDKTSAYKLETNSTLDVYKVSYIELKAGEPVPTNNLTITVKYFFHGSGDYFNADSYSGIDYEDIPKISLNNTQISLADVMDFRPRIADNDADFASAGASLTEMPIPFGLIRTDVEYYLPRIDKVYVTSRGDFGVVKGVPAIAPNEPATPDNSMLLYKLSVPAYTESVADIQVEFVNNRRYTMRDIGKLDTRITNLEYYTTLNLLEAEAESLQVFDPLTGQNRFKNGFIVDNFVDHSVGAFTLGDYKCSVSKELSTLRPEFSSEFVGFDFDAGLSSGVVKTGALVTLPYTSVAYISQMQASSTMNVNPYAVYRWVGNLTLSPASDSWFDTVYAAPEVSYKLFNNGNLSQQWNSWGLNWTGGTTRTVTGTSGDMRQVTTVTTNLQVVGEKEIDKSVIPFMRPLKVQFAAKGLLPKSRVYPFFDNVNVSAYCKPASGTFGAPLIADIDGEIVGEFVIPNNDTLKFRTGSKQFTLIDNPNNDRATAISTADADFTSSGVVVTKSQSILATRNITQSQERIQFVDPLAQSFLVDKKGGIFLTGIDVYFQSKDAIVPVNLEIRNMVNGYPGQTVVPYSKVTLKPSQVNVSSNASVATSFVFDSPVYLIDGQEYCFVLLSNCNSYNVYVGKMGETLIGSSDYISKQPYVGVLFKSQNSSTWTAEQTIDMKFQINMAKFDINVQGVAAFISGETPTVVLEANPLVSTVASNIVTVRCPNHGLIPTAVTTISGVTVGNGIPLVELNTTHEVVSVSDFDTFTIRVTTNATSGGSFGGNAVNVTKNVQTNTMHPIAQQLVFENTDSNWTYEGTTSKSINGTEVPYAATGQFTIPVNENVNVQVPLMIANGADEADKSLPASAVMRSTMETFLDNISPVIDTERLGVVSVANRINNPVALNETGANGGASAARYITNIISLEQSAEALKLYLDVNRPQGTAVNVYYKIGNSSDEVNVSNWTLLPVEKSATTNLNDYAEFVYGIDNLTDFSFYQFKIVLTSESTSIVPSVRKLRGIALGT